MKKILTYSLITVMALFLGLSNVSADEENPTTINDEAPVPTLFRNSDDLQKRTPLKMERERKEKLQEEYRKRLDSFVEKYKTKRVNFASSTNKVRANFASTTEARERLAENKERQEERRGQLNEKRRERIERSVLRIADRFDNVLEKITKISERVASRIKKMEERGIDMTTAKAFLDEVPAKIEKARVSIQAIKDALDGMLDSDNPKTAFKEVRELVTIAKTAVKDAHRALIESVKAIKASIAVENENEVTPDPTEDNQATTTPEE